MPIFILRWNCLNTTYVTNSTLMKFNVRRAESLCIGTIWGWSESLRITYYSQAAQPYFCWLHCTYIFRHLHKQRSSCRLCQNLGLQTENRLAKQNSDIIYLWLPSVSFEFNCLQTFVRTFHLSDGQAALHACRAWGLVIGKASVGPWNS